MNLLTVVYILSTVIACYGIWDHELSPHAHVQDYPKQLVHTFLPGNATGENLRVLLVEGDYVLVGGRNTLYNISLVTMQPEQNITWNPTPMSFANCQVNLERGTACGNFIRVVFRTSSGSLLVCGTHAFAPRCRVYKRDTMGNLTIKKDTDGKALCPADARQATVYIQTSQRLFSAVSAYPKAGRWPVIYGHPLRTSPNDSKLAFDAQFVGVVRWSHFLYFFFRESVRESRECAPVTLATVARLCTSDSGSPSQKSWSTFSKARLRCSLNGSAPHNFTNLQDISWTKSESLVYAVFGATGGPVEASAVCVFSIASVNHVLRSNRSIIEENCPASESQENAIAGTIFSYFDDPLLVHVGFDYHYTTVAVEEQVATTSGRKLDVLFVGTSHGHVIKIINLGQKVVATEVVEDIFVFPEGQAVLQLKIVQSHRMATLLVVTYHEVVSVPLDNCNWTARTCEQCVGLQDPYCAWDSVRSTCVSLLLTQSNVDLVQNVTSGHSDMCRLRSAVRAERGSLLNPSMDMSHFYSGRTFGLALSFCVFTSVIVGVFTGYWCNGHRKKSFFYLNYK
ncbi:semaphorin-1A-like [Ornithodoros turicata]|uniref:semaphorin-1A-like n=1 Tax=Ornithodoros turicata TaxID=34597 RepID=UPI0031396A94